ncbi:MAG: hypothetical protein QXZ12_01360 [Thermoplasmata archaeon]
MNEKYIVKKGRAKYFLYTYKDEHELEELVKENYKDIFGENCIWFEKKKEITSAMGISSIPDGFVISIEDKKWYVVEVELSSHDVYKHISIQISSFQTAIKNDSTKNKLIEFFNEEIKKDSQKQHILEINNIVKEQYKFIQDIVKNDPEIIVIIDDATKVAEVLGSFSYKSRAIEFNVFTRNEELNKDSILIFEPLTTKKLVRKKYTEKFKESTSEPDKYEKSDKNVSFKVRSRDELKSLPDGLVIVCAADSEDKEDWGVNFLKKYNLWEYIRIEESKKEEIKYIAFYVNAPQSEIVYFAEVSEIVDPLNPEFREYHKLPPPSPGQEGKSAIIFKENSLIELKDPIVSVPGKGGGIQGPIYTELSKFIVAKTVRDLKK